MKSKINHVASRIRSSEKRSAVDRAIQAGNQFYMQPSEMYQVITEREEALVIMPWNVYVEILWQLYADLENKKHQSGFVMSAEEGLKHEA